jgi:hypothetical protein
LTAPEQDQEVPEFRDLPGGLVLDRVLSDGAKVSPFPIARRRTLGGDRTVAVTYMAFGLLELAGSSAGFVARTIT